MVVAFIVSLLVSIFTILIGGPSVEAFVVPSSSTPSTGIHNESLLQSSRNTLLAATLKNDDESEEEEVARRVPSDASTRAIKTQQVGVGRRGTLMSLLGGVMTFAASDVLLGAAGNVFSGGAITTSGIYGARWNALYQRLATYMAKHEGAVASPELLSWISKSPQALAYPELRAWMAAQRAFSKSRQAMRAAAVVEEGLAAVGAVAAAAVVTKQKVDTNSESGEEIETTLASTTSLEATSSESELSAPMNLTKADETTTTATHIMKSSSVINAEDGTENDEKEVL